MVRTSLPFLLSFRGLLTQSMWSTVSPGVQISAEGTGEESKTPRCIIPLLHVCSQVCGSTCTRVCARVCMEAQG